MKTKKKTLLLVLLAGTTLIFAVSFSVFTAHKSEQAKLDNLRSLPVPNGWQLVQEEDSLVGGSCLGTGSKCGSITKEYIIQSDMDTAMNEAIVILEREGWAFSTRKNFMSHQPNEEDRFEVIQVSAVHEQERLSLSVYKNTAKIVYTEQHNVE